MNIFSYFHSFSCTDVEETIVSTEIYIHLDNFSQVYKEKTQDHDSLFRLEQLACNDFRVYKPFSVLCETSTQGANFKIFYPQLKYSAFKL